MTEIFQKYVNELIGANEIDLQTLKDFFSIREVKKDEFIFSYGEVCKVVGFINKGLFRVFFLKDGKEVNFIFQDEHCFIGDYQSFFYQSSTPFYFQALEDTELLVINSECSKHIFSHHPKGEKLRRMIAERNFFLFRNRLLSLYLDSPENRYLDLIQNHKSLFIRIPQYHLASYLGIQPESLSRLRKRLFKKNLS